MPSELLANSQQDWRTDRILQAAERSLACIDLPAFFESVREQVALTQSLLFGENSAAGQRALARALEASRVRPRLRRALELALVPLYDKPLLPLATPGGEFLWLFGMPVCVTFSESALKAGSFALPGDLFEAAPVLEALRQSGHIDATVPLRAFSGLWQREDLTNAGPQTWATAFVGNELFATDVPVPGVVSVSENFPLHRTREFFVLAAARMPAGTRHLLGAHAREQALREVTTQCVRAGLARAGVAVDRVQAYAPVALAHAYLLATPSWQDALQANLHDAAQCGATHAFVRFPNVDYFEVVVRNATGDTLALAPAACALEPRQALVSMLAQCAKTCGLTWSGSFSSLHPSTPALH